MNEVNNGQIVAALGQWQVIILIVAALAVAYAIERLRRLGKPN